MLSNTRLSYNPTLRVLSYNNHLLTIFFFLNHQFITWCAETDCGSYFHNYIHRMQTNRILMRKEKKNDGKGKELIEK